MRWEPHVRFGERAGETDQRGRWHRVPVRLHQRAASAARAGTGSRVYTTAPPVRANRFRSALRKKSSCQYRYQSAFGSPLNGFRSTRKTNGGTVRGLAQEKGSTNPEGAPCLSR